MPIKIEDKLPARRILEQENIFIMPEQRASTQDIRPLRIVLLNLMPTKVATETQLLRLLSNTPLQMEITLLQTATHSARNTSQEHLLSFYKTFDQVRAERFDGLIVTGAPVELMPFEDVDYWPELCEIMDWANENVFSSFFICWGAQAALYHFYGIEKHTLPKKMFGVFKHRVLRPTHPLVRGFDEVFDAPHSRHTEIRREDILNNHSLWLLADSEEAGAYLAISKDGRRIFVTGHSEYDRDTLAAEYNRDLERGLDSVELPKHYFPDDFPQNRPLLTWRAHANHLYVNWLNYFVYQETPYDLSELQFPRAVDPYRF